MVEYRSAAIGDMPLVRTLFAEYGRSLGIDLSFQDFDRELATLPGKYSPPDGTVILASHDGTPCGCVALRKIDALSCEMKRLYVRPGTRGLGVGRELVRRILEDARGRGYAIMRLDTLATMTSAVALYRGFGFREIAPYIFNPIPGALYLERSLDGPIISPPSP
jgi:ribosomal protein S18 acetylase RimI-like enzyme